MKPEIRKIVTRSVLFFGILAVSAAGMQLANLRNQQNAPDAIAVSAEQSPVIVLDAEMGNYIKLSRVFLRNTLFSSISRHKKQQNAASRGALLILSYIRLL